MNLFKVRITFPDLIFVEPLFKEKLQIFEKIKYFLLHRTFYKKILSKTFETT